MMSNTSGCLFSAICIMRRLFRSTMTYVWKLEKLEASGCCQLCFGSQVDLHVNRVTERGGNRTRRNEPNVGAGCGGRGATSCAPLPPPLPPPHPSPSSVAFVRFLGGLLSPGLRSPCRFLLSFAAWPPLLAHEGDPRDRFDCQQGRRLGDSWPGFGVPLFCSFACLTGQVAML